MTSMTFGQLVEKQQLLDPSHDVVKASEYEIPFGKHKGMTLSLLMEQQHSYCMWLINQEESKNKYFNETCNNIKLLIEQDEKDANPLMKMTVDGVELVEGEKAILHIDPANPEENGVYETMGNHADLANGLLMGKLSDLLAQVTLGDLSFEFGEADIDVWLKLVSEFEHHKIDAFVVIATKHSKDSNNQRIKKIIPNHKNLKALKGVIPNA